MASGSSGALLRRKLIICGGQIPDGSAIKKCYFLTSRVREWKSDFTLSLMKPRAFAGALVTRGPSASPASGERLGWWITGGINRYSESTCKTSVPLVISFQMGYKSCHLFSVTAPDTLPPSFSMTPSSSRVPISRFPCHTTAWSICLMRNSHWRSVVKRETDTLPRHRERYG